MALLKEKAPKFMSVQQFLGLHLDFFQGRASSLLSPKDASCKGLGHALTLLHHRLR